MSIKEHNNSDDNIKEHPKPWNLLDDHHGIKIDPKFIVQLVKRDEVISNEDKKNCKVLHLTSEWIFEELLALFNAFNLQEYPNFFVVIIEGSNLEFLVENSEKSEKIKESVLKFGAEHSLILQLTSKDENMSKIFYKEVNSGQFLNISQQEENVAEIKDFSSLLRSFLDSKIENVEQITAAWQNIIKSSISMKFLKLFENLFFKLILEVTKSGTKADLLTVLDASAEHEGRVLSFEAQNYLSDVIYEEPPSNESAEVNDNNEDDSEEENESQTSSSVLLTAIEHKKAEIIEYLITYWTHLIQELPFDHQLEISTAAFKSNQLDVLCDLLDIADYPFPDDYEFDDEQEHKKLRKITVERMAFTNAIKKENFKKIDEFIDSHKSLKCVYSIDNETALTQAIDLKKFGVFYYLKSLGFQGENCQNILNELDKEDRKKATQQAVKQRKANVNQALVNVHKSVMLLATRSLIHNRRISKEQEAEYRQKIMNWLQDIHKVAPEMLNVAASCEHLKIIFDFESHTVENASLAGPNSLGSTYPIRKWIFVGAQSSNKKREQQIKGVLAHELCHYVMRLVYDNQENPYYEDRKDMKEIFERIVIAIDKWSKTKQYDPDDGCGRIISSVFTLYKAKEFHLELIVRVVQILTEFDDDEEKTRGLEQKYQDLFNFWHHQVIPELQLYLQKNQQVKKLNRLIGFLPKILKHKIEVKTSKINEEVTGCKLAVITTNIPMLLFVNICGFLKAKNGILMDSKSLFVEPEKLNNLEILNKFKQICRDVEELNIFVDCTKGVPECLGNIFIDKEMNFIFVVSSDGQRKELIKIFDTEKMENVTKVEINYNWNDLTEESQKSLLETEIYFQNSSEIALKEFFVARAHPGSESLNAETDLLPDLSEVIDDELLNMIIDNKMVKINSVKEPDQNEKYSQFINVERRFIKKIRKIDVEAQIDEVTGHKSDIHTRSSLSNSLNSTDFVPDKKSDDDVSMRQEEINRTRDNTKNVINELKISQEELLLEVKNQKFVLISDKAGNGKSWAMKNFTKILHQQNRTSWVTYVDLKQFIKEFKAQEGQEVKPEFSTFLAEKIFKTEHKFESKIFKKLYKDGKIFILFDGFDEIAPNCAEFVSKLAQSFKSNGGNQLWIATRDYFEVDLMKKLEIDVAYGLEEMTDDDGIKLILLSWILMDLGDKTEAMTVGDFNEYVFVSPNYNKYWEKAEKIVKKVKIGWNRSVGMPQMFKMIADAYKDEENIKELKESKIFEKYIKTLYRRWSREKGEIREEASIECQNLDFSFWKFHHYQAILSLYPALVKILFPKYDGKNWSVEEVIAFGILTTINGKYYFIHETLREYFAAEALAKALGKEKINNRIIIVFVDILTLKQYRVVRMFLNDFIDSTILIKIRPKMKNFIEKFNKMESFAELFTQNLENFIDFILSILKDCDYKHVKDILEGNSEKITKNTKNSKIFFKFQDFLCQFLAANDLRNLIEGKKIFQAIIEGELKIEVFGDFVLKIEGKTGHEFVQKELRKATNERWMQENDFKFFFKVTNPEAFKFQEFMKMIQKFLSPTEVLEFLKKDNSWHGNILLSCVRYRSKEILRILWTEIENYFTHENKSKEFKELVMQQDKYQRNILHFSLGKEDLEHQKIFWELLLNTFNDQREELKDFVLQKDNVGYNFVQKLALWGENQEIIETFKILKENFNEFQFQEIIQSKGKDNQNFIHSTAFGGYNIETFKFLWELFRSSFKSEQEFWKVLKEVDDNGLNIFNYAAEKSPFEVFNFLIDEFDKKCSKEEIKKMLSNSDKLNQSLLQLATLNEFTDTFKAVWKNFQKYLKLEEFLEIAKQVGGEYSQNFLFYVESSEIFEFAIEELEKIASREEIRSLLCSINNWNRNILQNAATFTKSLKLHETLWKTLLLKYFENSEIKNFIQNVDESGKNLLHLAVNGWFQKIEIMKLIWNEIKTFLNRDEQIELLKMKEKYGKNLIESTQEDYIKQWIKNVIKEYEIKF